ncbi:MAG: hypothetical protein HYV09_19100 [Deltaproteobacteria bacterium]|nr:hypothetical protein [Deltaproteobacteria bacterium]
MNVAHLYAPPSAPTATAVPIRPARAFTAGEVLGAAWRSYKRQGFALSASTVLGYALIFGFDWMSGAAGGVLAMAVSGEPLPLVAAVAVLPHVANLLVGSFVSVGLYRVYLAAARGEEVRASMLCSGGDALLSMTGASLLVLFATLVSMIALIVPGIVVSLALSNALWLVADRRASAVESLGLSFRTTRGLRLRLLGLGFASGLVLLLGLLALGVGVLVALPVIMLASAHAYLRMIGEDPSAIAAV